MNSIKALVVCVLLAGLSACASMSKNECLTADWRLIGFEDGASGSSPVQISERRKACAKHGISPDKTAYDEGYREGIAVFCSYDRGLGAGKSGSTANGLCRPEADYRAGYDTGLASFCTHEVGYDEGRSGRTYNRVCPPEMEAEFLRGYEFGREINLLQSRLNGLEKNHAAVLAELEANDREIETIKGRIAYDESLDGTQRADLLQEIDQLNMRNDEIAEELRQLDGEMSALHRELRRLDAN